MSIALQSIQLNHPGQPALFDGLSCTLATGELVALVGPSGSGKTSLLNLLAGLLTPTAGQVVFNGHTVTHQDARQRHVGMVFQDFALYPHLTVLDNVAFPLKMAHVKKRVRQQRARDLAALVHVSDQLDKYPHQLSGGQQQRVAIARALAKHPAVLLLDEPLASLDAQLRTELRDEIRRIQRATGVTTVFVTHHQEDALQIADRIIVLAAGTIQQAGRGEQLYQHPRNLTVAQLIGQPTINLLPITSVTPHLARFVPADRLARAQTLGIRSEALRIAPVSPRGWQLTTAVTAQRVLGRETQTHLNFAGRSLISTAITQPLAVKQPLQVTVATRGCFLFDAAGTCIWDGDADD